MAIKTNIPWCDSTVNFWEGCTKVSPGCQFCYAEARDRRMMIEPVIHWGKGAPRRKSGSAVKLAFSMNRKSWVCDTCGEGTYGLGDAPLDCRSCDKCGMSVHRRRIFAESLGDILDPEVPTDMLAEALDTIRQCDQCDWLLPTKRPDLFGGRLQQALWNTVAGEPTKWLCDWIDGKFPPNVWIGTSVEDKSRKERIEHCKQIPAKVHFLSLEPLLEDLGELDLAGIDWVIAGGESGPNARPCNIDWIRDIKNQCKVAGVPVFVKQLGSKPVYTAANWDNAPAHWNDPRWFIPWNSDHNNAPKIKHPKGGDPNEWPKDLCLREFPRLK